MKAFARILLGDAHDVICRELNLRQAPEGLEGCQLSIGGYFWPGTKSFLWPYYWVMHDRGFTSDEEGNPVHGSSCMRTIRGHNPMLGQRYLLPLRGLLLACGHQGLVEVETIIDERGDAYLKQIHGDPEPERPALKQLMTDDWEADGTNSPWSFLSQIRLWSLGDKEPHGYAVGVGQTARKAFRDAEEKAAKLRIPHLCYRSDGGVRVRDDLRFIEQCGWLR